MKNHPTFQDVIDAVRDEWSAIDVLMAGGAESLSLMGLAVPLFEQHTPMSQETVMACMFGQLLFLFTADASSFEMESGVIITPEQRMEMFQTKVWIVYRACVEASKHPDFPKQRADA